MFETSNFLEESISLNPNFDKSSLWLSSGMLGLDEKLAQIKSFSGFSSDYGDFLQASSTLDNINSLYSPSSSEISPLAVLDSDSVFSIYDNSFSTADDITNLTRPLTITDFVGNSDTSDMYRFSLSSDSSFNLSLNGLIADADVELFNVNGTRIASSAKLSTQMEALDRILNAGTYYVQVKQYKGDTNYRLGLSATPIVNNIRTALGTLDANSFLYESRFSRTVISGNGNVDFGSGGLDLLNLSNINSSTVTFSNASKGGGLLYNLGNGTRLFDAITLSNGNQILFEGIDRIQFADSTLNLSVSPNDPLFKEQWNLHMMGVHNAWRFTTGSNNVLVGIEDTGLGLNSANNMHGDLRSTTIFPNNYRDEFSSGASHGTAVQGIIAANTNNGSGMSGINWNSSVFNIDVLHGDNGDQSLAEASQKMINHANSNGQRLVINMSLGLNNSFNQIGFNPEFEKVVANNPNVLFVIAAGNDGAQGISGISYPATLAARYNNVISVGASWGTVNSDGYLTATPGERTDYSQYGTGLTLMGPSEVVSTKATRSSTGAALFDYYPSVGGFNGTSAATPNVTGVASLLWSANPNLSATQIKQILSQTSYDLGLSGYDTVYGSGFVNADAAVRRALAIGRGVA
jgi:serine protease